MNNSSFILLDTFLLFLLLIYYSHRCLLPGTYEIRLLFCGIEQYIKNYVPKYNMYQLRYLHRRRQRGHRERPLPKMKQLLQKNCVISECSIFRNYFSKGRQKFNFSIEFLSKIFKFSQNFPTIFDFRPNARKVNAWFVKVFGDIC